jgi:hypothetical protein
MLDYFVSQYFPLNSMLRRHPPELYNAFASGGNKFSTTIHVLNSAVCKLARAVRLPEGKLLFRGLGGLVELPDGFFKADERGCSGFAEWGFMSTTSNKEIAVSYSGVKENRPAPTVLVMKSGSVDRGACIKDFSQHPQVTGRLVCLRHSVKRFSLAAALSFLCIHLLTGLLSWC